MNQPQIALTDLASYLAFDSNSPVRHEYLGGHVYAMTGGSMRHNRIALNLAAALLRQLDGSGCQVFINDMRLHVQATDSVYYPDVFVHCGGGPAGATNVVHSAALVVEVLSESTAQIDRREKLAAYQRMPSLRAYWVVSQDQQHVEVHQRASQGNWVSQQFGKAALLDTSGLTTQPLSVAELYAGTDVA